MDVTLLQNRLGHTFKDAVLLQQALTHRSHSSVHNERLEFLGDSILNCVVASLLFDRYSKIDEGELKSGGFRRPSILADTLEALFGAIFLDAGFDAARDVIRSLYIPILDSVDPKTLGKDAKTLLQEYLQGKKIALPQYNVVATHGAAHNQEFEIECLVPKLDIQVFGTGGSRRAGEQAAAKLALEAVQAALVKTPGSSRKAKPRTAQLKLAGIATVQPDAPLDELKPSAKAKLEAKNSKADGKTEIETKSDSKSEPDQVSDGQKSLIADTDAVIVPAAITASKNKSDVASTESDDVVKKSSTTSHSKIA